ASTSLLVSTRTICSTRSIGRTPRNSRRSAVSEPFIMGRRGPLRSALPLATERQMTEFSERRWTTPDGLSLYARDYPAEGGEKHLPVLCLHGFTRNSGDFEDLAPVLAEDNPRVIVMDVRGRGQS